MAPRAGALSGRAAACRLVAAMSVLFRTTGTVAGPAWVVQRGGRGWAPVRMPVAVAVVERRDGLVLIDAGWSRRTCAFPDDDPGLAYRLLMGLDVKPEDAIASQLLSLGYSPGDVKHVVATHLHLDHIGGVFDFPSATLHAATPEWASLRYGRLRGYVPELASRERVTLHDFDGPGALGFAAGHDLFGDGTVLLLDARGHTAGSVAVAVKLAEGWALHAGDAAYFADDFRADPDGPVSHFLRANSWHLPTQRGTFARLRAAESEHGARVVLSHDATLFEPLPHTREDAWACDWDRAPAKPAKPAKAPKAPKPGARDDRQGD
jgi:glyoxylase-like metal-dependent hydrolase (beta-lactamase superfamily II)